MHGYLSGNIKIIGVSSASEETLWHMDRCIPRVDNSWGPLYQHGLTLIPPWISNNIHCGMKLTTQSQTPTAQPYILSMWLHVHAGIQGNPYQ